MPPSNVPNIVILSPISYPAPAFVRDTVYDEPALTTLNLADTGTSSNVSPEPTLYTRSNSSPGVKLSPLALITRLITPSAPGDVDSIVAVVPVVLPRILIGTPSSMANAARILICVSDTSSSNVIR